MDRSRAIDDLKNGHDWIATSFDRSCGRLLTSRDRTDDMRAQLAEALDDSAIGVSLVARLYDTVVGDLMALPDESAVLDALREVDDPEAGMNIVDLGLVYAVRVGDDRIDVDMTMTTPACPVTETLVAQAQAAIAAISPPATMVEVHLVWEPIWNPSMMSGTARDFFGWDK